MTEMSRNRVRLVHVAVHLAGPAVSDACVSIISRHKYASYSPAILHSSPVGRCIRVLNTVNTQPDDVLEPVVDGSSASKPCMGA